MNSIIITIATFAMIISIYRLYIIIKTRYAVRKFFRLAVTVEMMYAVFLIANSKNTENNSLSKEISLSIDFTREDVEDILYLANKAISCCERNQLNEFCVDTVTETYSNLKQHAVELRRWLWANEKG